MCYEGIIEYTQLLKRGGWTPLLVTTWVVLYGIMFSKIIHTKKDKYYDLTHLWHIEKLTNNLHKTKNKLLDYKTKLVNSNRKGYWGVKLNESIVLLVVNLI